MYSYTYTSSKFFWPASCSLYEYMLFSNCTVCIRYRFLTKEKSWFCLVRWRRRSSVNWLVVCRGSVKSSSGSIELKKVLKYVTAYPSSSITHYKNRRFLSACRVDFARFCGSAHALRNFTQTITWYRIKVRLHTSMGSFWNSRLWPKHQDTETRRRL